MTSLRQSTLARPVSLTGVGLHTGKTVTVSLRPASVNHGISFRRVDLAGSPEIPLTLANVHIDDSVIRCTTIGQGAQAIHTVEHLMAVLHGLGIDNLIVELDGPEMPGMDGSALHFASAIQEAGVVSQEGPKRFVEIASLMTVEGKETRITIEPAEHFRVTYELDYHHPVLGRQIYDIVVTPEAFVQEIAPARTFCLLSEADALKRAGMGKGANYQNTLVVGDHGVVENTLRFPDEFVRHKVLDVIGDLYLLGCPVRGHVKAYRSGHALNVALVQKIGESEMPKHEGGEMSTKVISMDINEIRKCLPHRYPFLFVDRILELEEGKRAVGIKNVTANDNFFTGHFPMRPVMPGVLMVEAMAQVSGILLRRTELHSKHVGLFFSVDKAKFRKTVEPGDQLVMEVEILRDRAKTASTRGVARVNGETVCEAEMMFAFLDEEYLTKA